MATTVVPSVSQVAEKWKRRSESAGGEYEIGIKASAKSWAQAATAGAANYKAGVNAAAAAGRFEKGIARAGDVKWQRNAAAKGPMRYSQGISVAQGDYSTGVAPYLDAMGRVDLPPRGPAGSDGNYQRVAAMGKALRQLKTSK